MLRLTPPAQRRDRACVIGIAAGPAGVSNDEIAMNVHARIAIALGAAAAVCWFLFSLYPGRAVMSYAEVQIPMALSLSLAACLGWVLAFLKERDREGRTRCRRCGQILRGLSEPRCPECGEAI